MGHLSFQATCICHHCHHCHLSHFRTKGHPIDFIPLVNWISRSPGWPWTFYIVEADPPAGGGGNPWEYQHPHTYLLDAVLSPGPEGARQAPYPQSHTPSSTISVYGHSPGPCCRNTPVTSTPYRPSSPQPIPCLRLDHSPWSIVPNQVLS